MGIELERGNHRGELVNCQKRENERVDRRELVVSFD